MEDTNRIIEAIARDSYGRLVAYLSVRSGDVSTAEDVLSEALLAALKTWPRDGLPQKPIAWLLTAAKRRLIDRARHKQVQAASEATLRYLAELDDKTYEKDQFPDERLKLLFVCAHTAIDPNMHAPLMLQTILGLNAAQIAQAFLVSPTAMAQRLVRVKAKIRDAGIPYEIPAESEMQNRLGSVLDAIYAAYGSAWEDATGIDSRRCGLADESLWLVSALDNLVPNDREVLGLKALILHCEARRSTRRTPDGRYVPLSDQDVHQWSLTMIEEAEQNLIAASKHNRLGRYQLEAAIQSAHTERIRTGQSNWRVIALLYEALENLAPAFGIRVGRAAAEAEAYGPEKGLALLDEIDHSSTTSYQPYWAVRAHLLQRIGRNGEARKAFDRAIGLTEDDAIRRFLLEKRGQQKITAIGP